jgi:hypothetical protein
MMVLCFFICLKTSAKNSRFIFGCTPPTICTSVTVARHIFSPCEAFVLQKVPSLLHGEHITAIATKVAGENANIGGFNMKIPVEVSNVSVFFFSYIIS